MFKVVKEQINEDFLACFVDVQNNHVLSQMFFWGVIYRCISCNL